MRGDLLAELADVLFGHVEQGLRLHVGPHCVTRKQLWKVGAATTLRPGNDSPFRSPGISFVQGNCALRWDLARCRPDKERTCKHLNRRRSCRRKARR
jgi:hypothetical protein